MEYFPTPALILATLENCGACEKFKSEIQPKYQSYFDSLQKIHFKHIHLMRKDMQNLLSKLPPAFVSELKYFPSLYYINKNSKGELTVEVTNPFDVDIPKWVENRGKKEQNLTFLPTKCKLVSPVHVMLFTSSNCPHCVKWKKEGKYSAFVKNVPKKLNNIDIKFHDLQDAQINTIAPHLKKIFIRGVPSSIICDDSFWKDGSGNCYWRSLYDNVNVTVKSEYDFWLNEILQKCYQYYLVVNIQETCGHCKKWKDSGKMEKDIKLLKNFDNARFILNDGKVLIPPWINSKVSGYPSALLVAKNVWESSEKEQQKVFSPPPGVDPRDPETIRVWIDSIIQNAEMHNAWLAEESLKKSENKIITTRKKISSS
jgi:thioredoxin-related protein